MKHRAVGCNVEPVAQDALTVRVAPPRSVDIGKIHVSGNKRAIEMIAALISASALAASPWFA
jgi:hypothetical protein